MTDTTLSLPAKEVEKTNRQVMALQDSATTLTIKSPADMSAAADLLESIKQAEKTITGRKEEITKPLMRGLASIRDLFKPLELTLDNAKKVTKAKVIAYQTLEEERIEKEKERIERRAEKGTIRASTAIDKLEQLGDVQKNAQGAVGKITTRMVTKVRIMDETMIPREYMTPNMSKITAAVLREGRSVPGVDLIKEKVIAS